jgi:transcription elongation factor Elf1
MEKQLQEIKQQLDRIEKMLNEKFSRETCQHEWELCKTTSIIPIYQCKKCGAYLNNWYGTTFEQQLKGRENN